LEDDVKTAPLVNVSKTEQTEPLSMLFEAECGLFERNHTSAEFEGTGVGLAIVRKAAERMGGRVGVESEPGQGSRFWLELLTPSESLADLSGNPVNDNRKAPSHA
jgi:light-regulated signal transduction histidine kinase (bacteriophytochrome)